MLGKTISKNGAVLALFAGATAALIAATFELTKKRIIEAERQAAQKALFEILPESRDGDDLLSSTLTLSKTQAALLGFEDSIDIYVAQKNNQTYAMILPALAKDGYSGDIKMIVGVRSSGQIAGVRVLSHKETPGLGDKVDLSKSNWIKSFDETSLIQPKEDKWSVKKDGGDFDQFTGATITPRAVVNRVKETLIFFDKHQSTLLKQYQDQRQALK